MQKIQKFHHSVTENGKLQVRLVTEYKDDAGNILDKKYGDPYTPSVPTKDVEAEVDGETVITKVPLTQEEAIEQEIELIGGLNLTGWDQGSKDIVEAITVQKVKDDFEVEKQEPTGIGLEEIITTDRVIDEDGKIAVRQITRIFNDGVEVSKKYHRFWIMPVDDPTNNDVISKAVAEKIHTVAVISAYETKQAALALETEPLVITK
jgi:hypothetical protein